MLMKKLYILLLIVCFFTYGNNAKAQCTPDPTCTDLLAPGEICPLVLADGTVGVPYSQVVTVIPPATGTITGYGTVNIVKIVLTSVGNMPPGLSYQSNPANGSYAVTTPATRYCILISGTPTVDGTYPLSIHVMPYINVGVVIPTVEQVDDTSLAIIIHPASSGYSIVNLNKFSVLDCKPNPFNSVSKVGFISPNSSEVKLNVFDVVGNLVYNEKMTAIRGENYFEFNGMNLGKGIYFYTVSNGKETATKQLIKN